MSYLGLTRADTYLITVYYISGRETRENAKVNLGCPVGWLGWLVTPPPLPQVTDLGGERCE